MGACSWVSKWDECLTGEGGGGEGEGWGGVCVCWATETGATSSSSIPAHKNITLQIGRWNNVMWSIKLEFYTQCESYYDITPTTGIIKNL